MMKRGELPVPSTVENLRLWLISGGEKGIRQTVDPGQAGYEILIKRYLEDRRKRVKDGNLSHQSYQSDLSQLELFKAYCEQADPAVTTISEADLDAFKVWVATYSKKDRPEGFCRKPKSIHYAVSRIKHMVEWGWSKRLLDDMPRNLKEFGRVKLPQPKPLTYANDELVVLYQKAREKARGALELYILLAINCGYSQIDIASLERGMVDFTTGIITRTRHKTGVAQHSKLWPITLDLLRKYAEPTGDLLLKTRNGNPLVWHKLRDDGKISTSDCILQAFNCLRKGITTKSFTDIRNTGASRIKHQYMAKRLVQSPIKSYLTFTWLTVPTR